VVGAVLGAVLGVVLGAVLLGIGAVVLGAVDGSWLLRQQPAKDAVRIITSAKILIFFIFTSCLFAVIAIVCNPSINKHGKNGIGILISKKSFYPLLFFDCCCIINRK